MKIQDFAAFPVAYTAQQRSGIKKMSVIQKVASVAVFSGLTLLTGGLYLLVNLGIRIALEIKENRAANKANQVAQNQFNPKSNQTKVQKPIQTKTNNKSAQPKDSNDPISTQLSKYFSKNTISDKFEPKTYEKLREIDLNLPVYFKTSRLYKHGGSHKHPQAQCLESSFQLLQLLYMHNCIKIDGDDQSPISIAANAFNKECRTINITIVNKFNANQLETFDMLLINYVKARFPLVSPST